MIQIYRFFVRQMRPLESSRLKAPPGGHRFLNDTGLTNGIRDLLMQCFPGYIAAFTFPEAIKILQPHRALQGSGQKSVRLAR